MCTYSRKIGLRKFTGIPISILSSIIFLFLDCLDFMVIDLTRHTMHNVICGGAKEMDHYLETLSKSGAKVTVIQGSGSRDNVVPLECSNNIKMKVPNAEVNIIKNADHSCVILGREKEFARDLEHIWASADSSK